MDSRSDTEGPTAWSRESLERGEVHLWLAQPDSVAQPDRLASYEALLADDERERWQRFRFERDRLSFLVTRALVRTTLSRYADVAPGDWCFRAEEHGRPVIASPASEKRLRFNLSHTRGLVACALTLDREIGVDVENRKRRGETLKIAHRFFSSSELMDLDRVPQHERRDRFFDYWTLKESYIKARGLGLRIPLEQFSFDLGRTAHVRDAADDRGRSIRISFDPRLEDDPRSWQFGLWQHGASHSVALAVRKDSGARGCAIRMQCCIPEVGRAD